MAIAFVQAGAASGTDQYPTVTLATAPTANHLLVAFVADNNSPTVDFTAATGWTLLTKIAPAAWWAAGLLWKIAGSGESATQNPATGASGSDNWRVIVAEYSGTATSSPVDVENAQVDANQTKTTPTVTPTSSVERLIVGAALNSGNHTWSAEKVNGATNGVSERGDIYGAGLWDKIVASTSGSYSSTALEKTLASNGSAHIALFKPPGAATKAPPPYQQRWRYLPRRYSR